MTSWNLSLFFAILYFLVMAVAGEPRCEGVEDFGPCAGEIGDFCPRDIACSCKRGLPFCSCPFYRGPNGNYWYMGEKCDQLWSTMDMIAICVFPGVALAFVVAVTAQVIYFCKTRSKGKTVKEPKRKSERRMISEHPNLAFIPEEAPGNLYMDRSPGVREQAELQTQTTKWSAPVAEARRPRGLNYYSDVPPASRFSHYYEGRQQSQNNGYKLPEDYQQQPHYSEISRPAIPPADYQSKPEPTSPSAYMANRPFSFGRPQVRTNADYYDP